MQIILNKKPKNAIIVEGFPGFGLVGTIASEFLIEHLKTEEIGKIILDKMPAMVAIHENKLVQPLGIFYNKKYNIVIVHAITASQGLEWEIADALIKIAKDLEAKEIISLEGVGSQQPSETTQSFFHTNTESKNEKIASLGINPLKEGIIMGVTGALLVKAGKFPVSCFFAEASTEMPDSKAAAKIIEELDKYLGLQLDYKPLIEQAQEFETKLKGLLESSQQASDLSEKKKLSYVG